MALATGRAGHCNSDAQRSVLYEHLHAGEAGRAQAGPCGLRKRRPTLTGLAGRLVVVSVRPLRLHPRVTGCVPLRHGPHARPTRNSRLWRSGDAAQGVPPRPSPSHPAPLAKTAPSADPTRRGGTPSPIPTPTRLGVRSYGAIPDIQSRESCLGAARRRRRSEAPPGPWRMESTRMHGSDHESTGETGARRSRSARAASRVRIHFRPPEKRKTQVRARAVSSGRSSGTG